MQVEATARSSGSGRYQPPAEFVEALALQVLGPLAPLEAKHAPESLYLAGDRSLLRASARVAVVGSRDASAEGKRRAAKVAAQLAQAGVVVVSGLARGIDEAAHSAAIKAGGRTFAVLGTPLARCYPAEHARLQEQLYREHLIVSQLPPGSRTFPSSFVERNRLMALLSHASIIVEAGEGSGTLSQAAETQRLGHPLFIMKSAFDSPELTWPKAFVEAGAIVLEDIEQVLGFVRSRLL